MVRSDRRKEENRGERGPLWRRTSPLKRMFRKGGGERLYTFGREKRGKKGIRSLKKKGKKEGEQIIPGKGRGGKGKTRIFPVNIREEGEPKKKKR